MTDIIYASAKTMAQAIRNKEVSAVELVEAHLARIEEVNPAINAVVMLAADRARAEAAEADAAIARGESVGALHGVPFTLKDSIDTEGVVTTGGTLGRKGFVPDKDATVAARLRAAGGILLGKSNTPELTLAAETDNLVYGRTNNPFDVSRTTGGKQRRGGRDCVLRRGGFRHRERHGRKRAVSGALLRDSGAEAELRARAKNGAYRVAQHGCGGFADAEWADGAVCGGPGAGTAYHIGAGLERSGYRADAAWRPGGCELGRAAGVLLYGQRDWDADVGDYRGGAGGGGRGGGRGLLGGGGCAVGHRRKPGHIQHAVGRRRAGHGRSGSWISGARRRYSRIWSGG